MRIPKPVFTVPDNYLNDDVTFLGSVWINGEWFDMYSKGNTVSVRWGDNPAQADSNELRYAHMLGGVQRMAAQLAGY